MKRDWTIKWDNISVIDLRSKGLLSVEFDRFVSGECLQLSIYFDQWVFTYLILYSSHFYWSFSC